MNTQEIKGNLARLLATENLVVEHRKVTTASFDVLNRVLTLPRWDRASNTVYDLLVGHEVGHALYTPLDGWNDSIPKDFINVVEDARIEKLMKRKFPGLAKDFYKGYQELNDQDFFGINDEDLDNLNLIDRINLNYKIGSYSMIPFEDDEKQFLGMIDIAETFADVIEICQKLVDFLNQKKEETVAPMEASDAPGQSMTATKNDSDQEGTEESDDEGVGNPEPSESTGASDTVTDGKPAMPQDEDKSHTQQAFDSAAEDLSRTYGSDPVYLELPKIDTSKVIVDRSKVMPYVENHFNEVAKLRLEHWGNIYDVTDCKYKEFKSEAQKEVNYLVKEFECRKSADAYARSGESKTGVLDTAKLHTYKYNEDLFKKVTILPDGKNHGMIFVLDWSGSMSNTLLDTVKQLLNLCWFCRKVQIPFEVYAFTYEWSNYLLSDSEDYNYEQLPSAHDVKHNQVSIHKRFSLLNFLTSRVNSKTFDQDARNLWRMAMYYDGRFSSGMYTIPCGVDLSGTPLNDTLVSLKTIIPEFLKSSKVQKLNVCILTDGDSAGISYDVDMRILRGADYWGKNTVGHNCHLRDRKIGKTYRSVGHSIPDSFPVILLENLKDSFPMVNFIGFRIATGSDFSFLYRQTNDVSSVNGMENVMKSWRKTKSWELDKNVGYDALYIMSATNLSVEDTSLDVDAGAKTTEIRKAFKTMLKKKAVNKKILSSFVSKVS